MVLDLIEQDKQHRALALDASRSFIVQAPAGSGKTELLIQRFLTLLSHIKTPEEILAITFTKKAANEMRVRVTKALKQALHHAEPQAAHAKQTWQLAKKVLEQDDKYQWNLIQNPNQLRIQTIDSLCSYLTRQLPLLSHFGAPPDISDHADGLYSEAVQEIIKHIEEDYPWSKAIVRLLLHLDNDLNKLHDLLAGLLAKRDQWLSYIQLNAEDTAIKKQLEHQLELVINDVLADLKRIFPKELEPELLEIARFAAGNLQRRQEMNNELFSCLDITALPGTSSHDKIKWLGLARLLLTKDFTWRKRFDEKLGFPALKSLKNPGETVQHQMYRQRLNALIMKLQDKENLRLHLMELFFLPNAEYNPEQWEVLQALLQVLKIAAAQLRVIFQQHGQIDFIENTQAALTALGNDDNPTDLALALDYQIKHILIDEFQDTSYTQYQLVEKLTQGWEPYDGRTLFIVGDPMQSIYRFREAEVGLFIRLREKGLHHLTLTPLTLTVNFRSSASIVDWNNTCFHSIFPSFNDMAKGAVSYSPSAAHQPSPFNHKSVEIKGYVNACDEIEAKAIVNVIQQIQTDHPQDKTAILVRSRSHLTAVINALKKAKMTYSAIDIDPLASRQFIQDLLSLTIAMLHPADRIACLSVLRAPWCGLSLSDLLIIAGEPSQTSIFQNLESKEIREKLSEDGQRRAGKIFPILASKIAERERYDLRAWIETTWLLLGGPSYLQDFDDIHDANVFFKLLETFSANYSLFSLDKLKKNIKRLYACTPHDNASLQIMTIHTAKGLEFDTVILPQLHKKNPFDDKALLSWMERPLHNNQNALLLAPLHGTGKDKDTIYEYITRQQRIKLDYETDRLLYVAATRAKKRLHLFFNTSNKDNHEIKIDSGSFLAKIWPVCEKNKNDILIFPSSAIETETNGKIRPIQRIQTDWINPVKELKATSPAWHKNDAGFQLNDTSPKFIGIVTHKILQLLAQLGIQWWSKQTTQQQINYIQSQLKQLGMTKEKLHLGTQAVLKSVQNTLQDEKGKWILHSHSIAKCEYAVTAFIENKIEISVIDRMFVDEHNILWIIDYKTAVLTGSDIENFLLNEQEKYKEKMQKYYAALKENHTGRIRLGLYFPALPAWREWEG